MSEPTSVRPELLERYERASQPVELHLASRTGAARGAVNAYLGGTDARFATTNPSLMGAGLTDARTRLEETRRFVTLLREAVLAADVDGGGGVVTLSSAQLMSGLPASQREEFEALLTPAPLVPIDPPTAGVIPQDSGFVDDPVCTATGHFLEDEVDLTMPERLAALAWPRRYSSRQLDTGGHGPGWWTWAEASCRIDGDLVHLVCPDGRHITFPVPDQGDRSETDGDDVTVERRGGGLLVRWGIRSQPGPQRWEFDGDGRVVATDSDLTGSVVFEHDADGRIVGLTHEGGRSLRVEWDDEHIVAVRSSDGRSVTYDYDTGHLVGVHRDLGDRTYATDVHGRIVEVLDADGVTLARNRYDELGRVVRQVAPTGRVTVFRYEPGRRTAVLDGAGDLIALYVHDHRGRVETLVSPHGTQFTRSFDADGCVASQVAHDGSGFTSEGRSGPDGVLRLEHHDGRTEEFRYDHLGRLDAHEVDGAGTVTFEYLGDSILPTAIVSPTGARRTMTWTDAGALIGVRDPDGIGADFELDADGLPVSATDTLGHSATVARHPSGVPVLLQDPDGGRIEVAVDGAGRVTRVVEPDGATSELEYSPAGRLTALNGPDGGRTTFHHGEHGLVDAVTDAAGNTLDVEIDEWGRPTSVGSAQDRRWAFRWSALGVLTGLTTPGGAAWTHELDEQHRVHRSVDPVGRATETERDDAGLVSSTSGPAGSVAVDRDDAGRPTALTAHPGGRTSFVRDGDAQVIEVDDADGVRTHRSLTPGGRETSVRIGDDVEVVYDRDAAGRVAAVRREDRTWTIDRDWRGNPIEIRQPSGRTTRVERDAVGRVLAIDRTGITDRYRYDAIGRMANWTRPSGVETRFEHDHLGRLVAVDGPGGRTRFEHDLAAGTTTAIDPFGERAQITVDADGNLIRRTDQLGRSTVYEHRADGQLAAVTDADGHRLGFEHDDAGRIAAAYSDGEAAARYRYHNGHLAEVEEPGTGRRQRFETTAAGRISAWSDAAGGSIEIERDDAGRVVGRRGDALPEALWTHEPSVQRGTLGGRPVLIADDEDGVVRRVAVGDGTIDVQRTESGSTGAVAWTDGDARRTLRVERDAADRVVESDLDGARTRYGYDDADRLASVDGPSGRIEWRHDAAGRPVSEIRVDDTASHERRFAYDAAHQLVTVDDPGGTTRFEYDGAGRRVAEHRPDGTIRRFEWDGLGRLAAVVDDGDRLDVDIDCFGLLRGVGDTALSWDHSGARPVLAAVDDEAVLAVGHVVLAVGDRLLADHLVGPAALGGGRPWGEPGGDGVRLDCGVPGGIGFAGLIWLGDRILDPATCQFLTPDPLAAVAGSPTQSFPYGYADGDPVNRADPTGRNGQPISIEQFEQMRERGTGVQWGNVAMVAGAVAMTALAFVPGVNVLVFVAAGAVVGGTTAGGMSYQQTGSVNPRDVVIGAAFGAGMAYVGTVGAAALRGGLTGMTSNMTSTVASHAPAATGSLARDIGQNVMRQTFREAPLHALQEGADSYLWGGDGQYELGNVARGTAMTALSSGAGPTYQHFRGPTPITGPGVDSVAPPTAVTQPLPALPAGPAPAALPAPRPMLALEAGPTMPALPAPAPMAALPAGPTPASGLVTVTPSLSLPPPPSGMVATPSGLYVPN